jgi:hypothetical protein
MGETRRKPSKRSLKAQQKTETLGKMAPGLRFHVLSESSPPYSDSIPKSIKPRSKIQPSSPAVSGVLDNSPVQVCYLGASKGYGLVAATRIPPGTLVLEEEPVIRLTEEEEEEEEDRSQVEDLIQARLQSLSATIKKNFKHLHDTDKAGFTVERSIYYSNCYNLSAFRSRHGGSCLGLKAARINHSCIPNVQFSFVESDLSHPTALQNSLSIPFASEDMTDANPNTWSQKGLMRFHAIRAIRRGEEILSNYDSAYLTARERRLSQQSYYGFQCDCRACSETDGGAKSNDNRTKMIQYRRAVREAEMKWRAGAVGRNPATETDYDTKNRGWDRMAGLSEEQQRLNAMGNAVDIKSSTRHTSNYKMKDEIPAIIDTLQNLARILRDEKLFGIELADTYNKLAKWSERADDLEGVKTWLKTERETCLIAFGEDSRQVRKIDERLQRLEWSNKNKAKA